MLFFPAFSANKTIKPPPHAEYSGNLTFQIPNSNGTNGQYLKTDGNGVTSWGTVSGGSTDLNSLSAGVINTQNDSIGFIDADDSNNSKKETIADFLTAIAEFKSRIKDISKFDRQSLEPLVNELIKTNNTNFKGVGQPLRIALTGSKYGPGIYDIIISLGKEEVLKRLGNKIFI